MKRSSIAIYLIIIFLTPFSLHAQKKCGDENYANYNYRAAINCYSSAYSSNPNDTASLIHLAICYSILKDYDNAEKYFAMAVAIPNVPAYVYLNYGKILKINGKLDKARDEFSIYSGLNPYDTNAKDEIRYCDNLKKKYYLSYQVAEVDGINTKYSEFAPAFNKDNLVFVSNRGEDMVNFDKNSNSGGNYFKMFNAKPSATNSFSSPSYFTPDNSIPKEANVGPAAFTADGKMMCYTQVSAIRKKGFVNQAKLYFSTNDGKNWSKPQPFQYNSDTYSVMDPSLSADGQELFFASNMPGGYGGNDIYECQKTNDGWSKPVNLGSDVNTPGNEVFPCIRKDGMLFFSSDRHFNYGGLDIFSAEKVDVIWTDVENLGPDINSTTDDFGICFNSNGRTGYFSSNRKDGKGEDDIYSFYYVGDYRPMKGFILASYNINDPVPGIGVRLLNDSGHIIGTAKTDSAGAFIFTMLDPEKRYAVRIDENDPRFKGKLKFYMADTTGKIVAVTIFNKRFGNFVFTQLPPELHRLPKLEEEDKTINIAGNLLHGDSSKPVANVTINLTNEKGEVVATATTNEFGAFVFRNLPPNDNYHFQINAKDSKLPPNTRVVLNNKNGEVVKVFYAGSDGNFRFELLASDTVSLKRLEVKDNELRLSMKSTLLGDNKQIMPGVKVNLVDMSGNVVQSTTTDQFGQFSFTNLPPDKTYFEQIDVNDPKLKGMKRVYVTDSKGNIVHALDQATGFKFEVLASDKTSMGSIYVYDPWITALNLKHHGAAAKDSLDIIENIYYDYQKWDILPAAARVLDKVISVMRNDPKMNIELDAYTDPRGTDEFNLNLSQKRAQAAVDYIVNNGGINRNRLVAKGFGKTHLINNCGDPGVNCSEEELAKNRRTEFKITRK